ncbi:hypothetical protein J6590_031811 [Homalodisca vitripennis]|nr:hypothetical protein J6590_031811 [Homalodisca vitripennis]
MFIAYSSSFTSLLFPLAPRWNNTLHWSWRLRLERAQVLCIRHSRNSEILARGGDLNARNTGCLSVNWYLRVTGVECTSGHVFSSCPERGRSVYAVGKDVCCCLGPRVAPPLPPRPLSPQLVSPNWGFTFN